jgi:hypothetical protein
MGPIVPDPCQSVAVAIHLGRGERSPHAKIPTDQARGVAMEEHVGVVLDQQDAEAQLQRLGFAGLMRPQECISKTIGVKCSSWNAT